MAKRMALVPESWLRQMNFNEGESKARPTISVVEPPPKTQLIDLAELLPKNCRHKAKMLLHYLEGHVQLNDQQRVVYANGQLGSHIVDLVKYFVASYHTDRPIDAPKFQKLMIRAGVPNDAIAKKTEPISNWHRL